MPKPTETSQQANDGFLVNGSVNNAATSQFTLAPAFGNTRKGYGRLYTGGLALILRQLGAGCAAVFGERS